MGQRKLLVVDDNYHQHKLIDCYSGTLPEVGVEHRNTLDEALEYIEDQEPDLVLLDNRLFPYSSFTETVPEIRNAGYTGKIVVMSADLDQPEFRKADSYDVHACVDKADINIRNYRGLVSGLMS